MKFVGQYTQTVKDVLTASALSGVNAVTISAPGWGKTEMALETAYSIVGADHTVFVEIDPSTPPEVVRGSYDPAALLNGELRRVFDGTPYDPSAKVVILDELWRSNDILFDALIHATAMKTRLPADRPVFWATSNFVGNSARTEALRDRFGLWVWLDPALNVRDTASAHMNNGLEHDPDWGKGLPVTGDIDAVRTAHLTKRAQEAVLSVIETLAGEATAQGFVINPRRLQQWASILSANGMYQSGTDDFSAVPDTVTALLRYAYPCADKVTAQKWAQVSTSVIDALTAVIEEVMANAYTLFKRLEGVTDPAQRSVEISKLGAVLSDAQTNLKRAGGNDPRVSKTVRELTEMFASAVSGTAF